MPVAARSTSAGSAKAVIAIYALLIHGARAIVGTSFRKNVTPRPWLKQLLARRSVNVAAVAVAHKTARALWAMITREEGYRRIAAQAA